MIALVSIVSCSERIYIFVNITAYTGNISSRCYPIHNVQLLLHLQIYTHTRKVKVLSPPETIKEKSTFRAKALRPPLLTPDEGPSLETSIFPLSFQVVREPLPFAYHMKWCLMWYGSLRSKRRFFLYRFR